MYLKISSVERVDLPTLVHPEVFPFAVTHLRHTGLRVWFCFGAPATFQGYSGLAPCLMSCVSFPAAIALAQTPRGRAVRSTAAMESTTAGVTNCDWVAYTGKPPRSSVVGETCLTPLMPSCSLILLIGGARAGPTTNCSSRENSFAESAIMSSYRTSNRGRSRKAAATRQ